MNQECTSDRYLKQETVNKLWRLRKKYGPGCFNELAKTSKVPIQIIYDMVNCSHVDIKNWQKVNQILC